MSRLSVGVLVVALLAVLAACDIGAATAPPDGPVGPHPERLAGTSWVAVSVGGLVPARGSEPSLAFAADAVRGSGGCNQLGGRYAYDAATGRIAFDELGMTAMACAEPERNAIETRFIQLLGSTDVISLDDEGRLIFRAPAGEIVLVQAGERIID